MFPLRSKLFIISRSTTPLNFTDLNSYSTEISSQNKFFDMYIVKEKATRKFLMQNFLPGMFKMTNFDRFHREAMGVRGLLSITRLLVYFFDELKDHLVPLFLLAGGVNAFAGVLFSVILCDKRILLERGLLYTLKSPNKQLTHTFLHSGNFTEQIACMVADL